jgi:hypothetical protein
LSVAPAATTLPFGMDLRRSQTEREEGRSDDSPEMENIGATEKPSNTAGPTMDSRQK